MAATVVLVHGAWHGAWCWEKVVPLLDDAGVAVVAVDLPGHGDSPEPLTDLSGDATALRRVLEGLDEVVIGAHSYGGAVATEAAAGCPMVRHLVYLSSFPLEVGESATRAAADATTPEDGASELGDAIVVRDAGTCTLDPERAVAGLYHDCAANDAAKAVARLGPQALAELQGVVTRAAWHDIPSTYVVCTEDRAVSVGVQRVLARRCTRTIEWPTSHSPFLSRPDLVADLLIEVVGA